MSGKPTGKTVKEIKKKSSSVVVVLSDGEKLKLSFSSYTEFRLYEGKTLSEEELSSLLSFEKEGEFYDFALKLLGKDNYTIASMRDKLLGKGADERQASSIIERLKKEDLLNDERYAKIYVEDIASLRLLGKNKVLAELKRKGIEDEILLNLAFPRDKELEKARSSALLLNKKYAKAANAAKKDKAIRALLVKGFSYEIAEEAIEDTLVMNDKDSEKESLQRDFEIAYARAIHKYEKRKALESALKYLLRKGYSYEDIIPLINSKKQEEDHDF